MLMLTAPHAGGCSVAELLGAELGRTELPDYRCEGALADGSEGGRRHRCSKAATLLRLPDALVLHVNQLHGAHAKSASHVAAVLTLNLGGSTLWGAAAAGARLALVAVVVHHGGALGGHYTTFRWVAARDGAGAHEAGTWLHISDESVRPVEVGEVQACSPSLLFYVKKGQGVVGAGRA
jgi:hypothetical protein